MNTFLKVTSEVDKIRSESFLQTFPKIKDILNKKII
jgi:hypothetical protein